jgi:hypothetical protein
MVYPVFNGKSILSCESEHPCESMEETHELASILMKLDWQIKIILQESNIWKRLFFFLVYLQIYFEVRILIVLTIYNFTLSKNHTLWIIWPHYRVVTKALTVFNVAEPFNGTNYWNKWVVYFAFLYHVEWVDAASVIKPMCVLLVLPSCV